jgi:hypothetical protein
MKCCLNQRILIILCAFTGYVSLCQTFDSNSTPKVENFSLIDHKGVFHELYYYENDPQTKAIVLFVQGNGCPLVRKRIPELQRMARDYQARGIRFWMLNANLQDELNDIQEEAESYGIELPILIDESQLVAEALGIDRTGEAILVSTDDWTIQYRGAVDDRLDYQTEKPESTQKYLVNAIDALLNNQRIPEKKTVARGCRVSIAPMADVNSPGFYEKTIAPILINKCVGCHTMGGIGPFALKSHRKVRGWSDMIQEVVMTGQMPPWQADRHIGDFKNDLSLSPNEKSALIRWIKADMPFSGKKDPLKEIPPASTHWSLGKPDAILEIPKQSIPAEGIIDYRHLTLETPFDRDVWLRAIEIIPGNTQVLHHVIATAFMPDEEEKSSRFIAGYAPGSGPDLFPENTGILLKAGSKIRFQLHYTTSGRSETDQTQLGLFLHDEKPERELVSDVVIDTKFRIPPRDGEFVISKSNEFDTDVILYSMNPHMHFRGKWMRYEAHYPGGRKETLLSVPNFNFNWQRSYNLTQPKHLPAGTRLKVYAAWDNSSLNTANPDPSKEVRWGDQSFDEMFFAMYKYTEENSSTSDPDKKASGLNNLI